jgi:hypothetical protein
VGANALRSGALSDRRVIERINARYVPVWVDVRKSALPPLPDREQFIVRTQLDASGRVCDTFSQGFFLRTLVVSSDGRRLLNPQPPDVAGSRDTFRHRGHFSYAQVKADDYLEMLDGAERMLALAR